MIKLYNDSPEEKTMEIHTGDAIAQGIIQQYFKTEDDSPVKSKRNGGLGSTG